jgi:competence protein ComEC
VRFELLHPRAGSDDAALKPNARSCVLRVQAANGASVLLAGDIERAQELALADGRPETLRADVLLVPHHGSRTSSTARFVDAVRPRLAVVQAGHRSRFGHPAPDVVARYRDRGIVLRQTSRCGALQWRSDRPEPVCERDAARRYWHHPDGTSHP